jgi:high-affinity nickel-transport protein
MNPIRLSLARAGIARRERRGVAGMAACVGALHVLGWVTLIAIVVPRHVSVGTRAFGLGIGFTAYVLGLRHAFDADHIAAIDNTTRRMIGRGERPLSVGFWFSLGHASVVFALSLLLAVGAHSLPHELLSDHSGLRSDLALVGTTASGGFLYALALLNIAGFVASWRFFKRMRSGEHDDARLDAHLSNRGLINRIVRRLDRPVDRPWHMYGVGVLLGLGFDTATEVALLVAAGTGAAAGIPWYGILCLPVLFAAGMSLLDTIDGVFMNVAYGWALAQPVRKLYYNLTITGLSVAIALTVGTIELAALAHERLGLDPLPFAWAAKADLGTIGFLIVALFCITWTGSVLIWRYGRIEQRWDLRTGTAPSSDDLSATARSIAPTDGGRIAA